MNNTITIETYGCACGYNLEIEQNPEYPKVHPLTESFYTDRGWIARGMHVGECPNCYRKGRQGQLARIIDHERQSVMEIRDISSVDRQTKPLVDSRGRILIEEVGMRSRQVVRGGEIVTEEVPVMSAKTRELNREEKQAEIEKIRRAEDMASLMEAEA